MKPTFTRRIVAVTTLTAVLSCGSQPPAQQPSGPSAPVTAGSASSPISDQVMYQTKDLPPGLDLRLSTGKAGAPPVDHTKLPAAARLADGDAQALLSRATPIKSDAFDTKAFALRPKSTPPPRTGTTIHASFPPPASSLLPPVASDAGKPLEVLRHMPDGAVPIAPEMSVTFSQPMVAVTSQADAASTTPVKLSPAGLKGSWRWIGTRTIVFKPDIRFPQATTYSVEVPAGTKSAAGQALAKPLKFTFETPTPTLTQYSPQGGLAHLDEPMFAMFDQKIDPAAVLEHIRVVADGKAAKLELLDAAAIAKDKRIKSLVDSAVAQEQNDRWVAFHAIAEFPAATRVDISVDAGTPSAEGPNKTKTAQKWSFSTYAPLKIVRAECGYDKDCRPGMAWTAQFNNPLDADKFDDAQVTVTPAIPNLHVVQSYSNITLQGATKAHTTYHVAISKDVTDEFGQALKKDASFDFTVGAPYPAFFGPEGMVVLDPAAKAPTLDVFTTNYPQLDVQLYKVTPADLDAFRFYLQNQWNHDKPPAMPGTRVVASQVATTAGKDALVETHVDLKKALNAAGLGHAIVVVQPYPWKQEGEAPRLIAWTQATKLGLDAFVDGDHLVAFASDLATGKALSGVAVEMKPFGLTATTDDKGIANIALPKTEMKGARNLTARRGDDIAMLVQQQQFYGGDAGWVRQELPTQLSWFVVDDRQMYKPGEEVALKGWIRALDPGKGGDIGPLGNSVTGVDYTVTDATGTKIANGTVPVSAQGGFDAKFTLPKTPNLGHASISLEAKGWLTGSTYHQIQIQEFRRPEFEVSAHASTGPFMVGGSGDITASAKYFSGGPLPGAPVTWNVTASQTVFTPPNRDDFVFGVWRPWWSYSGYDDAPPSPRRRGRGMIRAPGMGKAPNTWQFAGTTDGLGEHVLHMDMLSVSPAQPMSVVANAGITDVNRQQWNASQTILVHPSSLYVGLKTKKPFVDKGKPFPIEVIGVDLEGKPAIGSKIEVRSVRLDYEYKKGKYVKKEVDPQTCAVTAAKDASMCQLPTTQGGTYEVTATIVDAKGRPNQTTMMFWVTGGDLLPSRELRHELVQVIPDKKDYAPGDTAELLVQSPFYPAEGVVSWRRSGIVKTERIALTGPTTTIKVPIADAMTPNMYVQVDVVGASARNDDKGDPDPSLPKRPAYASGYINLSVPPKQRTLQVSVAPNAPKIMPGETASMTVMVRDQAGRPMANAETAIFVVDEAILSLSGYKFTDPIDAFYGVRQAGAVDYNSRGYVKLAQPDLAAMTAPGGGGAGSGNGRGVTTISTKDVAYRSAKPKPMSISLEAGKKSMGDPLADEDNEYGREEKSSNKPVKLVKRKGKLDDSGDSEGGSSNAAVTIRTNFNPLAAFSPAVKTDAAGRATVQVKMPDSLTRYRIVAISTANDRQFGKGESTITARLPLMVRPSPPRFLNFGDTLKLPVVVQNQTDLPMTVRVAVRATNAKITDGAGREVLVPANDRVEVQFPAAAEMAGTARFQFLASSGGYSDASELALPVWTPATTEAFATYGVIDDGAIKQPVQLPDKVVTQFGGLEVTTASTNLQSLTDAMLYLVRYPYECAEQRSSRVLAIANLRDVLTAFKTKDMPSRSAMEASVADDIEHLSQMQNYDGGFAYWDRGRPSEPYLSVFVANALVRAQAKGYAVPPMLLKKVQPYLRNIESFYPWYYGKEVRQAISSFALYTRKQMGDLDIAKGQKLLRDAGGPDKFEMEAQGWLLGTFAGNATAAAERKAIVRYLTTHTSETAGAANFVTHYGDGKYLLLASDRRVDAVILESLIQEQKDSDVIPKIVTGLLAHRKAGRWLNTQENSFVIQALDVYFNTYEKVTPDFVARAWLGNDYAGDKTFKGRSTDYYQIDIPMKDVATHDKSDLTIQKDGAGRLYYRVGMTYAPASLKLDPADYGFVVQREYQAIDDAKDVTRAADGTWHVRSGARVKVHVTMVNQNRRYHVALVDPMPAGFEAMNPALAVTGPIPLDPKVQASRGAYWWWTGPWYDHQNMRDERVEAFAPLLWEGVHTYDYVARATTPGSFVVPPPKAEEMYMPETFGRGASDRVVVE